MPITATIDPATNILAATWTGQIEIADVEAHWRWIAGDAEALATGRSVADLRAATLNVSGDQIRSAIYRSLIPALNHRTWHIAVVVAGPLSYGIARQFNAFAGTAVRLDIFDNIDAAVRWLQENG